MTTGYWESEDFREELRSFVSDAVGEPSRLELVRLRPWSTVWRATTPEGVFYVKDNCPGQRHEADTVQRLARLAPDLVVPVASADPDRGLLLTPDQGAPASARPADLATWVEILTAAARLQRVVAPHVGELRLTVLDPGEAVALVQRHLEQLGAFASGDPRHLADDERRAVEAVMPDVGEWADQVAALGLPLTVQHNDLHADNVFVTAGGVRFFDFGDAVASEPMGLLRIPLNVLREELGLGNDDPRLRRLLEPVLEAWTDIAPLAELWTALPAALQLARLARVESWLRCLEGMSSAELEQYGSMPARWLATLAEPLNTLSTGQPTG